MNKMSALLLFTICALIPIAGAQTADELFDQIQKLKSSPLQPEPANEEEAKKAIAARITEIDGLSGQFQKSHGSDPRRWLLEYDAVESADIRKFAGIPALNEVEMKAVLDKIAAAPDAPAELKASVAEQAAAIQMRTDLKTKPMELSFESSEGKKFDMADLRGKVVLIDFWATWCPPCIEEIPNVVAVYNEFKDKGFTIVGISLDQDLAKLAAFTKENNMPWIQYCDGKGWDSPMASKFSVTGIPEMWLVGKDGKVASFDARADLRGQVAKLLGK